MQEFGIPREGTTLVHVCVNFHGQLRELYFLISFQLEFALWTNIQIITTTELILSCTTIKNYSIKKKKKRERWNNFKKSHEINFRVKRSHSKVWIMEKKAVEASSRKIYGSVPRDAVQKEGERQCRTRAYIYRLHCNLHRALALENAPRYRVTRATRRKRYRAHVLSSNSGRCRWNKERRFAASVQSLFRPSSTLLFSIHFPLNHLLPGHTHTHTRVLCYSLILLKQCNRSSFHWRFIDERFFIDDGASIGNYIDETRCWEIHLCIMMWALPSSNME